MKLYEILSAYMLRILNANFHCWMFDTRFGQWHWHKWQWHSVTVTQLDKFACTFKFKGTISSQLEQTFNRAWNRCPSSLEDEHSELVQTNAKHPWLGYTQPWIQQKQPVEFDGSFGTHGHGYMLYSLGLYCGVLNPSKSDKTRGFGVVSVYAYSWEFKNTNK